MRHGMVLLTLVLGIGACTTGYVPRPSPRIVRGRVAGSVGYYRDGRFQPAGVLLGGLVAVTADDSAANDMAWRARTRAGVGYAVMLAALGGMVASDAFETRSASLAVLAGSACVFFGGVWILDSAGNLELDAINAYNDAVDERPRGQ